MKGSLTGKICLLVSSICAKTDHYLAHAYSIQIGGEEKVIPTLAGVLSKGRPSPRAQAHFAAPHRLRSGSWVTVGDKKSVHNQTDGERGAPRTAPPLESDLELICRDLSKLQHATERGDATYGATWQTTRRARVDTHEDGRQESRAE